MNEWLINTGFENIKGMQMIRLLLLTHYHGDIL